MIVNLRSIVTSTHMPKLITESHCCIIQRIFTKTLANMYPNPLRMPLKTLNKDRPRIRERFLRWREEGRKRRGLSGGHFPLFFPFPPSWLEEEHCILFCGDEKDAK